MPKKLVQAKLNFSSSQPEPVHEVEAKQTLKRKLSDGAIEGDMASSKKPTKSYAGVVIGSPNHDSTSARTNKSSSPNRGSGQFHQKGRGRADQEPMVGCSSVDKSPREQDHADYSSQGNSDRPSSFQRSMSFKSDVDSRRNERTHSERRPSPHLDKQILYTGSRVHSFYNWCSAPFRQIFAEFTGNSGPPSSSQKSMSQKSGRGAHLTSEGHRNSSSSEVSEDEEDNNVKKTKYTPKTSSERREMWKGVAINTLKRAPECYRKENLSLPDLQASYDHKVLFEIPSGGWNNKLPKIYPKSSNNIWNDDHVYMPNNQKNEMSMNGRVVCRWEKIAMAMTKYIPGSFELEDAILSYNPHYKGRWDFEALHKFFEESDDGTEMRDEFFEEVLPEIQNLVLQLPELCPKAIPILKQRKNMKITLTQEQIACLLANAFFCTFPKRNHRNKYGHLTDINFSNLYSESDSPRKFEKFKCIINYFRRVTKKMPTGTVTYARQVEPKDPGILAKENNKFTNLHVSTTGTIEDDGRGMLQADFANKYVGGGVLGHGLVQEEIRFLICPEMILSRLFTEVLTDNEVLIMTGCERFSNYEGYSSTFKYSGNHKDTTERDEWGRRYTEVVAMDALVIRGYKTQFEKEKVFRELHKAYVAFKGNQFPKHLPAVCTGNWGCGAFGGDKQLKALIQMMAASAADRDICYFTFGDAELCDQLGQVYKILKDDGCSIKHVLDLIKGYSEKLNDYKESRESLFEYIIRMLGGKLEHSEEDPATSRQDVSDDDVDDATNSYSMESDDEEYYKANTPG